VEDEAGEKSAAFLTYKRALKEDHCVPPQAEGDPSSPSTTNKGLASRGFDKNKTPAQVRGNCVMGMHFYFSKI
jgi:hypothetical protein